MATTCVLGHAWADGWVLCPTCGFGRRNIPAPANAVATPAAAAPFAAAVASPVLVGAAVGSQAGGYDTGEAGHAGELILSPDGYWAWDGENWVPAESYRAEVGPGVATVVYDGPSATDDALPATGEARDPHRINPKLMLAGVVVIAALVSSDIAFGLAPLGHKSTSTPAPVVVHHPTATPGLALARTSLTAAAEAEVKYRAKSGLYTNSVPVLKANGFPGVAAPAVLEAVGTHGTGFCVVDSADPATNRWYLYDSTQGGIQTTVFTTAAKALTSCRQPA